MFHCYSVRFQVRITEKANLVKSFKKEEISCNHIMRCVRMWNRQCFQIMEIISVTSID